MRYFRFLIPLGILVVVAYGGYMLVFSGRILPGTLIGVLDVGGMTHTEAVDHIQQVVRDITQQGLTITVNGKSEIIRVENIDFQVAENELAAHAYAVGRSGTWYANIFERVRTPFTHPIIESGISFHDEALHQEIAAVARIFDEPGKDIRFLVQGTTIKILTDTKVGHILDQGAITQTVRERLGNLDGTAMTFALQEDIPVRDAASISAAKKQAERIIAAPFLLESEAEVFTISPVLIGQWLTSATGPQQELIPDIDPTIVSAYVTTLASQVNIAAQKPAITIEAGKVTQFNPPRSGKGLDEESTIQKIIAALRERRTNTKAPSAVTLPIQVTKPVGNTINGPSGIVELIGKATTTFAGSPANRISNIKNGVKFLTGILVAPGEEFSTLKTLGIIDNTTGYLPELVIKENRTLPEFGGGLCQVSTTLFRSVLNAGLPVTARRNHSYRVTYYEKDALGHYIGPGLDATIYEPEPDFRFLNDTGASILIYGYVIRDTVTFELYGTHDGRVAEVKGPTLLSTIPAGDQIYTETDTLPVGVTKQIETAHPGGTATATYLVTYPSGTKKTQVFKSSYRRWPAQYLVGTAGATPSPTP